MTTRHSLFTRSLSLLLALVMVLSNMSGLTLQAKAAEFTLGDVLEERHYGEDVYKVLLANVEALPKVAEILETPVDYPEDYPDAVAGSLINGWLELEPVNGWVPAYYNVDGFTDIPYEGPVQLDPELDTIYVSYEKDLGVADQVNAANELIRAYGREALMQGELLDDVSNTTALTALSFLDVDFIKDMIAEVENLTLADLDDEEATEEDLEETKAEYVTIIGKMLNRLVEGNNPYMAYESKPGKPEYKNYLVVYAMLAEYDEQGLRHYYENREYINSELKELSAILYDILGEKKADGSRKNEPIVDALLENMGYANDVNASQLTTMAGRMDTAATYLPTANYSGHTHEIDLSNPAAVDALFYSATDWSNVPLGLLRNLLDADLTVAEYYELDNDKHTHEVVHVEAKAATCYEEGNVEYWYCNVCETVWADEAQTQIVELKTLKLPVVHNVEHVEAKAADCFEEGNIEYWYCTECGSAWTDELLHQVTNLKSVILPVAHNVEHVEAKANSCFEEGNIEYWYCTECGSAWTDELLRQVTNLKSVILAGTHNVEHVEAKAATCFEPGNIEYWYCADCGYAWTDELLREVTNLKSVVLPITHSVEHVEAKAATCFEEGNIECWYCTECGSAWTDELLREVTNLKSVILPIAHNVEHVEAKAADCFEPGNIEYWYCTECGSAWTDELLREVTNLKSVILPISHAIEHVEAKAPTATVDGNIEYWYCTECGYAWTDELLREVTNLKNVIIPATGVEPAPEHDLVHVEAVAAGCHFIGNVEHWYCTECDTVWTDEALTQISNHKSVIIPAIGAEVIHVEAKAPACYEEGNIEHWYCEECEQVWQDEALTQLTNHKNVILGAAHVNVEHVEAVAATCFEQGNIEHWYCTECDTVWADEALTQITNHKSVILPIVHSIEHVEAKAADCFVEGNIEYWYCTDCGYAWTDELLREVTNLKNVILPAGCKTIRHIRATKPSCYEEGNVKYWFCEDCERVWLDEARTQLSNLKRVILPAACQNIVNVEAVAPACESEGNIEHWYCADCERVWQDEALTQLTNFKNVVVPATHTGVVYMEAVAPGCHYKGRTEYWFCADCEMVWADENLTQITNRLNVIVPELGGDVVHVDRKEAICGTDGNIEYWYCEECEQVWQDEARTQLTNIKNVVIPNTHMPDENGITFNITKPGMRTATDMTATYELTCAYCEEEVVETIAIETVVLDEVTCSTDGLVKHVAAVELNGVVFSSDDEEMEIIIDGEPVVIAVEGESVEEIVPATGHENLRHYEAVAPGCHFIGNVEYWYCPDCDIFGTDEDLKHITSYLSTILPELGGDVIHVEAKEPNCYEEGNIEHWYCEECEQVWQDEARTQLTNHMNVKLGVKHELIHVEAVAPACHYIGNIEHWYCTECDTVWQNEALTQITNHMNVIVPAVGGEVVHVEAVTPSCYAEGNIEYWYCEECEQVWQNEALTQMTNFKNVVLPAACQNVIHVEAKTPSCYEEGNIEYWYCEDCLTFWQDENRMQITNAKNVLVAPAHQNVKYVEAIAPGCHFKGQTEYWYCADCDTVWANEELTQITNRLNVTVPELGGDVVHVEGKTPTCFEPGNIEYWYCEECEQVWQDEARTQLTNHKNVIRPADHTNILHMDAVEPGCHYIGNVEYWHCYDCGTVWTNEERTQISNYKSVILPELGAEVAHIEAKEPGCFEPGNIEYWFCAECEQYWQDEARTQLTNIMRVIIPAQCANLVHMDAVEPGCHYIGNVEYWICYECERVWTDEAQTQLTNTKNVIVPELGGDVIHVEAKEPTLHENGNIEYWYCEECEQVWQDEARTQLTNIKNVVIPSVDSFGNSAEEPIEVVFTYDENTNTATASVTLGRGVWNLSAYGIAGMIVTANGEEIEVTATNPRMPATFQIINMGYEDVEYTLKGAYPVGHQMNPVALTMGKNTAVIEEGNDQGYYFTYTATETGTVKVTMPEGDWTYQANNLTSGIYGDIQWSDSETVNPYVLVNAGDEVQIIVNTYDPESNVTPAGEVAFQAEFLKPVTVSFRPAGAITGSAAWSSVSYQIGHKLTEADIAKHVEAIQNRVAQRDDLFFNEDNFMDTFLGYTVTGRANLNAQISNGAIINEKKVEVSEDGTFTLLAAGFEAEGTYLINFNGTEKLVYSVGQEIEIEIGSTNELTILEYVSALKLLAIQLNEGNNGNYVVTTDENGVETLTANITMGDITGFAQGVFDAKYYTDENKSIENAYILTHKDGVNKGFQLDGIQFIYSQGGLKVNMNSFVQALLNDEQFSNESLIELGNNGKGALLHTTISTPYFQDAPFVINLTSVPSQMAQVAELLTKARGHFWFEGGNGALNTHVNVPEKAYEALTAYALLTGEMDKIDMQKASNMMALIYVEELIGMLQDPTITVATYNNTLQMLGIDKNLDKYAGKYNFLKNFISDVENFDYYVDEVTSGVYVNIDKMDINDILSGLGLGTLDDIQNGADKLIDEEPITTTTLVTIENEIPGFDAIILDPTRIVNKDFGAQDIKDKNFSNIINGNTSWAEKAQAINMTTNLSAQLSDVYGASAIMLVDNVNGDLVFNHTTILDLNGKTVNGSIVANAPVIIMDSSIETVSGAKVTGSVSGNATILAGIYGSDVSAFLRDGYYQDGGAVKNAMYVIENGKLLVDPSLYIDNVDGYLPAAHYLAAEVAVDIALNYYTAAGLYVNGKYNASNKIYDIHFEDLVGLLGNKSAGLVADEVLACINTVELSDFINKILADLVNVDKVAAYAKTGDVISTYTFAIHPWSLNVEHVYDENNDYLTAGVTANADLAKYISLGLAMKVNTDRVIEIPKTNRSYTIQEMLDELAKIVVTETDDKENGTKVEILVNQPVRDGKNLIVGGSATATINLDFSHNENYNRILGAALAYFYEDLTLDLVKNGCIVELNEVLAELTVGEFVDTCNKVIQNKEIPFEKIAAKLELDLSADELAKLTELYDKFQNGVAKVIAKFDLDVNPRTPLSDLIDNNGNLSFDADLNHHSADAFYKGFGLIANVDYSDAKVIIKLAKGDHTPADAVIENEIEATCMNEGSYDEVIYCAICGEELSRNTVVVPVAEHKLVHVEAKDATCFEDGNIEHWYCTVCEVFWADEALTQVTNSKRVIIPAQHLNVKHVEAKAATCIAEGNIEYWYCEDCGYAWLDAELKLNTNLKAVILPLADHTPGEAVRENGEHCEYDMVVSCEICGEELSREHFTGLLGDANCDGEVDNIDAMLIARYDVGLTSAEQIHIAVCDVNGDGDVDNIDAMLVARYDVGLETKYPIGQEIAG